MMQNVFRAKRWIDGKRRVARTYTGQYRLASDAKPRRVSLGVSDKQVAQEKLRQIVREAERQRAGLSPTKHECDGRKQSVEKLIAAYIESRRGLRRDEKYVRELQLKLLRLRRECKWRVVGDITAHSFEGWRATQRHDQNGTEDPQRVSRRRFRIL
jgi:hypothetical protein